ncbi:MAG TPA: hypothetical protein VLB12_07695 [Gemmatimonadales bacterium]|nr:hypothetical protein [Gemmatimonadales bacterium]
MMHPKLRWVMFTAALGFLACHGDPTDSLRNGIDHLTASPTDITISNGDSVAVTIQAVDEQGNVVATDFSGTSADPLVSFQKDNGFLPVYDDQNNLIPPTSPTRARFFVKALGVTFSTVTVTAGGKSRDLSVLTLPTVFGGVYATDPSNVGLLDTVSVAPPAGLSFDVNVPPTISGAPGAPLVIDFTASNLSFIPAGGTNGPLTVQAALDYAGGGLVATLTDTTIINKPGGGTASGSFATAPVITLPASGTSYVVYDNTPFNNSADCLNSEGVACRLYRLDLAAPATFDLNATWFDDPAGVGATTDLGVYWVDAGGNDVGSFGCDNHGNDGAPETCTVSLPAGTFYMAMVTFAPFYDPPDDVDPPAFQIEIIAP